MRASHSKIGTQFYFFYCFRSSGMEAVRDIVQFVELRRFLLSDGMWDQEGLAKAVLAEVPKQLVKWMTMRGLKPFSA